MTPGAALEQRVVDHPDDDASWSVLADHLIEQGDALGTLIAQRDTPDIAARRAAAIPELDAWAAVIELEWRHGVPMRARLDASEASSAAEVLEALGALAALPAARFLRELVLTCGTRVEALEIVATSSFAARLRVLDAMAISEPPPYGVIPWGNEGARALAPLVGQLIELDLGGQELNAIGAVELASAAWPALEVLRVAGNAIVATGADALIVSDNLPRLRVLDLHNNRIRDDGIRALAHAAPRPALRTLTLGMNRITDAGVRVLAGAPLLQTLEELTLFLDDIGDDALDAVIASPHAGQLDRLHLVNVGITDDSVARLAGSALLGQLTELSLGHNAIGDRGVAALAASPALAGVVRLNLEMMRGITDDGLIALAASPHIAKLEELWLWTDQRRGVEALLAAPQLSAAAKHCLRSQHPELR